AMRQLWTKDEAEYHGRYFDFPPVRSFPKPVQKPHPPVLTGGNVGNAFKRAVEWCDGWIPTRATPELVREGRQRLTELAVQEGRDPASIQIVALGVSADREELEALEEAGADAAVVRLTTLPEKESLAELEQVARKVLA
ncbi:MAG: LLM class flavin-dependent oxidoreductase, partial [Dehalococcoidia bacterium]|nr:LLM class flavin-dependent oxidoreductase [Dehalococcoidia bacterium]